jgi:hypothetical protein
MKVESSWARRNCQIESVNGDTQLPVATSRNDGKRVVTEVPLFWQARSLGDTGVNFNASDEHSKICYLASLSCHSPEL